MAQALKTQVNINSLLLAVVMLLVGFTAVEAHRMLERIDRMAEHVASIAARQQMDEQRILSLERRRP